MKSFNTPMSSNSKLDSDEKDMSMDQKIYRDMIGFLLYLTASRSIKRIIRYLNGTQNIGLWYDREFNLIINANIDLDFASYKIDRKSTSGAC